MFTYLDPTVRRRLIEQGKLVRINAAGQLLALPVPTNTSGDFAALTGTDGYLELAREQKDFPAGTTVPLHRWQHR